MVDIVEKIVRDKDIGKADIVIESYKPLLIAAIRKYYNKPHLYEELLQEGALEICEAILDFDESKNIPFSGYLKSRIYYFYLGKNHIKDDYISLDIEYGHDEEFSLLEIIPDDVNIEEEFLLKEKNEILYSSILSLTKRQRNIVLDFYFNGFSIKDISKKYDISYRTVVNTKTNALKKMKNFLEDIGK